MNNPYKGYYLEQQQGRGMGVFRGSSWQMGNGQVCYGLGGLFRSVARSVMPIVKSGAKSLGNIALNSGASLLGDVLAGKILKEAGKTRAGEAANTARDKAVRKLQTMSQTGNEKRPKKRGKKRKSTTPAGRSRQTKKRKTSPEDIFG